MDGVPLARGKNGPRSWAGVVRRLRYFFPSRRHGGSRQGTGKGSKEPALAPAVSGRHEAWRDGSNELQVHRELLGCRFRALSHRNVAVLSFSVILAVSTIHLDTSLNHPTSSQVFMSVTATASLNLPIELLPEFHRIPYGLTYPCPTSSCRRQVPSNNWFLFVYMCR